MSAINKFSSFAVPLYLTYSTVKWFFGSKVENALIAKDHYAEGRIKIRPYGVYSTLFTVLCIACAVCYFAAHQIIEYVCFWGLFLFGYLWVKIQTYCVTISFSSSEISYRAWTNRKNISYSEISMIGWKSSRHSLGYVLAINCENGARIDLSSRDFVGLSALKKSYDLYKCTHITMTDVSD